MTADAFTGPRPGLRADRARTVVVLLSLWAWCGLLCFPMIGLNEDYVDAPTAFGSGGNVLLGQIAGLALFLTSVALTRPFGLVYSLGRLSLAQAAIIVIIFVSLCLQLQGDEGTAFVGICYTTLLLVAALALSVLWTLEPDDLAHGLTIASVVFCLFGVVALTILGLPENRNVGGIQPNLFAAPLMIAFIFSQFRPGLVSLAIRILCFAMVALVSSRFAVIGCTTALVVHELTFRPLTPWKAAALVLGLFTVILLWPNIASILALDDPNRDVSSGFSGRDEYWYTALAAITDHPFGLGFKRATPAEGGHNGYLKTVVEFGVVGGGMIVFLFATALASAAAEALRSADKILQEHRFACARLAGLVALAFGAFFQPQLLSLGDAFGVSLLFLLFRPRTSPVARRVPAATLHAPAIPG
ncbi:hypothetical protein [Bradyrhizobium cajani]|uniref:O-antigen ligase-related domain-containing protein n=1 Tax=Bradyrhizobium cajani TaxID=1928661 RepID=A0A844TCD6_9BRAD|nr:hypothetical protein [Bradyrhizobium cajani]MCP3368309.1 hypothetical protein [Bradyrhizobium cajani]MVT73132.1 hypothetical protein [Bradyrhizobium cajani]